MGLKGSKTEKNLKDAFAGESQANRRYLYFANKADVEGQNDVAMLFRSTAEGETGHAHGHLEFLEAVGDPATGLREPSGFEAENIEAHSGIHKSMHDRIPNTRADKHGRNHHKCAKKRAITRKPLEHRVTPASQDGDDCGENHGCIVRPKGQRL